MAKRPKPSYLQLNGNTTKWIEHSRIQICIEGCDMSMTVVVQNCARKSKFTMHGAFNELNVEELRASALGEDPSQVNVSTSNRLKIKQLWRSSCKISYASSSPTSDTRSRSI